jgi:hypothetical protein
MADVRRTYRETVQHGRLADHSEDFADDKFGNRVFTAVQLWKERADTFYAVWYSVQTSNAHNQWRLLTLPDANLRDEKKRAVRGVSVSCKLIGNKVVSVVFLTYYDGTVDHAVLEAEMSGKWSAIEGPQTMLAKKFGT